MTGHFLPEDRAITDSFSITGGRHENMCSHAGYLYALHKGDSRNHAMERGRTLHRVIELAVLEAITHDHKSIPPELVKAIVNEVLADPDFRVPIEEHDFIRESAFRWATHFTCEPSNIVAVEQLCSLDVGGFRFRGKLDYAELVQGGDVLEIQDFKSSRSMPTWEQIGRKRPDGSIAAKDYQLIGYALSAVFGRPVTVSAEGSEQIGLRPLAARVKQVDLAYVFPGVEFDSGMGMRNLSLTRTELHEYMDSFAAQAARIQAQVVSGDWPATPGDHCGECPAMNECSLPAQRDGYSELTTVDTVRAEAEALFVDDQLRRKRWSEIKGYVKNLPDQRLRFGTDRVIEAVPSEFEEIKDRDALFAAAGTPGFNRDDHVVRRNRSPITVRKLTEDEIDNERRGSK